MFKRSHSLVGGALIVGLALSGCTMPQAQQAASLGATFRDLELEDYGDALCDESNHPTAFDQASYSRIICVDGAENAGEIFDRLAVLRFTHDPQVPESEEGYLRRESDRMSAEVEVFEPDRAGEKLKLAKDKYFSIPEDGGVTVTLLLPFSSPELSAGCDNGVELGLVRDGDHWDS